MLVTIVDLWSVVLKMLLGFFTCICWYIFLVFEVFIITCVKWIFCMYWKDYMVFLFYTIYMVNYIDSQIANLHTIPRINPTWLWHIIYSFNIAGFYLLNFVQNCCINVHSVCWIMAFYTCDVCVWFWYLSKAGHIKGFWKYSLFYYFLKAFA